MSAHEDAWYLAKAKQELHRCGELEFDDNAVVSTGGDNGAYVQCWAWVEDDPAAEEDDE
jgi:hypothetical protein